MELLWNQIELFSFPNTPERITKPEACGLKHLAFIVRDIVAIKKELEMLNVTVEEIRTDMITQKRYTFFKDPDGLPLEIYED